MRVRARLFARLREQAGSDGGELLMPGGATVDDVYAALARRHPDLEQDRTCIRPARNLSLCEWEDVVSDDDEIAFLPPVSGGRQGGVLIELTSDPLDPRRLEAAVTDTGAGAISSFIGVVRDRSGGRLVTHLEYEAYREMAVAEMHRIAADISDRWPRSRVAIAHRVGTLEVGEAAVVVAVSCPHRAEAIAACHWGIDQVKATVPIWKKEFTEDGQVWIEGDQPGT